MAGSPMRITLEAGSISPVASPGESQQPAHDDFVLCCDFSSDGEHLATGGHRHLARVWSTATGDLVATLAGHAGVVYSCCFASNNAEQLVTASEDQTARLWNVSTEHCLRTFWGHDGRVLSCAVSFSGRSMPVLATGAYDKCLRVWDLAASGECLAILEGHEQRVRAVAFTPEGGTLASGGDDEELFLWDIGEDARRSHRRPRALPNLHGSIHICRFSPSGELLATGGRDHSVRLWLWKREQLHRTIKTSADEVMSCCFSADNRYFVTSGESLEVQVWSVQQLDSRSTVATSCASFTGHTKTIFGCAISPKTSVNASGKRQYCLASVSHDKTARVWNFTAESR